MNTTRSPRAIDCAECGGRMHLIDCGVPAHHRTRNRREQLEGRCTGRVYAHDATGGMECV